MLSRIALLTLLPAVAAAAPIKVAVIDDGSDGTHDEVLAQLVDDTHYDFDATLVTADSVTPTLLAGYDVVLAGDSGYNAGPMSTPAFTEAMVAFQSSGGGVVASSWVSYLGSADNYGKWIPIDQARATDGYCGGPTTITRTIEHPVMDGVTSFVDTANYTETPGPLVTGAVAIATAGCNSEAAVIVRDEDGVRGRQVYLGSLYFGNLGSYNNANLRTGEADRVLEQALAWAAGCGDADGDGVDFCDDDCDDGDPDRYPGNTEACDGVDNDCDGSPADFEADDDDDGYRICEGDCDDDDDNAFPGNAEVCDDIDNDCNDQIDDGLTFVDYWPDADGDGFGDGTVVSSCEPLDGHATQDGDCDDSSAAVNPDAVEIKKNDIDDDCDGEEVGGCSCQSGPAGGALWALFLPGVLLLRRRRRS